MKNLITTKVDLKTHKKVYDYAMYASIGREKRMTVIEAFEVVITAGLKALKKGGKK